MQEKQLDITKRFRFWNGRPAAFTLAKIIKANSKAKKTKKARRS